MSDFDDIVSDFFGQREEPIREGTQNSAVFALVEACYVAGLVQSVIDLDPRDILGTDHDDGGLAQWVIQRPETDLPDYITHYQIFASFDPDDPRERPLETSGDYRRGDNPHADLPPVQAQPQWGGYRPQGNVSTFKARTPLCMVTSDGGLFMLAWWGVLPDGRLDTLTLQQVTNAVFGPDGLPQNGEADG